MRPLLVDSSIELVEQWLDQAAQGATRSDQALMAQLAGLIEDPQAVAFTMGFVDRVARPDSRNEAANQLQALVAAQPLPDFLSAIDKLLLRAGAVLAPRLPAVVVPLARRRMRQLVGHLVVDSEPEPLAEHLATRRAEGFDQNVNLLGEAVLGETEAERRFRATAELLNQPDVDYVSVKVSAIASQLEPWARDEGLERIVDRLRLLFEKAAATSPPTFLNLDMEEYHDLELTIAAFTRLLDEPLLRDLDAGIVLQAYLPDALGALQELVEWATVRHEAGGGQIKVRLVKGANLAMEKVDAAIHSWTQTPYDTKAETDANYVRCLDWVLTSERTRAVRIGVASHNLFHVAYARLLSQQRGVDDRVEFEMLQGMAPAVARSVLKDTSHLLLYTPIVARDDFDVAISYLFRRLEENSAPDNFMRSLFSLAPGSPSFEAEAVRFRASLADSDKGALGPRRRQDRPALAAAVSAGDGKFQNEPDTDPVIPGNRRWAKEVARPDRFEPVSEPITTEVGAVDAVVESVRSGALAWAARSGQERGEILHVVADELARRRGDLINAMIHEGTKTFAQADPEVSEAIDFARYYGDSAISLDRDKLSLEPMGVVAVVPPWNFPVAIPTGGVTAALAAGNGVILKPAPETPRCAEILAECAWAAGVPRDVLAFTRTPDDFVGQQLITSVDGVILTGGSETAEMFRSWKPDMNLLAETSGKNALIVTPSADIDLAVADLVASAFGHSGQKCSAASLVICVGEVYSSPRFRRQLVDAVESLNVGQVSEPETTMGPLIATANERLRRALNTLEPGESWLVKPRLLDATGAAMEAAGAESEGRLWSPGVRLGVKQGSWFHRTECFGPVLGIMAAADLDEAIKIQNSSAFGLTGGIHSLDPAEIEHWIETAEVGNGYVNRPITGAIVRRQPFGGWKRSSVGPGMKAGGPNYVRQLGSVSDDAVRDCQWLDAAKRSDLEAWRQEFGVDHDPSGLFCESNVLRYRPVPLIAIRVAADADPVEVERVAAAAELSGAEVVWSRSPVESAAELGARLASLGAERLRIIGSVEPELWAAVAEAGMHLIAAPVVGDGRVELLHFLREQAISRTLHRFGNLVGVKQ